MPPAEAIRVGALQRILLKGREVEYCVVRSKTARKLRIRVSLHGVQVVLPEARAPDDVRSFLLGNEAWVVEQLARTKRLNGIRRHEKAASGQVLLRGESLPIKVVRSAHWQGPNRVARDEYGVVITYGPRLSTPLATSLENWLRKEARQSIGQSLADAVRRVKRTPNRVYVMGQRTKWGNCSALGNLSFNWRLIMAPDFVLQYIVAHETVHLAIPDHSRRFWLTVQSLCPTSERARQWLVANGHKLTVDLSTLVPIVGEHASR